MEQVNAQAHDQSLSQPPRAWYAQLIRRCILKVSRNCNLVSAPTLAIATARFPAGFVQSQSGCTTTTCCSPAANPRKAPKSIGVQPKVEKKTSRRSEASFGHPAISGSEKSPYRPHEYDTSLKTRRSASPSRQSSKP